MRKFVAVAILVALSALLIASSCAPNKALTAAEFYGSKTVEEVVCYAPGGSVDFSARLFSSYWADAVKGGSMVVASLKGGAGIAGHNYIMKGPQDGLTLGATSNPGLVSYPVYGGAGVQWENKNIQFMGMLGSDQMAFILSPKVPYKSFEDLKKAKGLKFAGMSPSGSTTLGPALISYLFGLDAKIILGYASTTEMALAAAKGEVDGYCENSSTANARIKQGLVPPPLVTISFTRRPLLPNIPALPEVLKLTPEQQTWLGFFEYIPQGTTFFVRDGVPADRVKFLQDTFDKIIAMSGFKSQFKTYFGAEAEPVSGKELADMVGKLTAIPGEAIKSFNTTLGAYLVGK